MHGCVVNCRTCLIMGQFYWPQYNLPATDASLVTSDITTNNSTVSKHGFLKKLSGVATQFMDGTGNWTAAVLPPEFITGVSVTNFAALPDPALNTGLLALVLNTTGVWLVNYKSQGIYYSDGVDWLYKGDYTATDSANEIVNAPSGSIAATTVQNAINEIDGDIQALEAMTLMLPAVGGTANAITLSNTPPHTVLADIVGHRGMLKAALANTSTGVTINIDGLGALNAVMGTGAVPVGDIRANNYYCYLVESVTQIRIAPFDATSTFGDTINGNLLVNGRVFDSRTLNQVTNTVGVTYTAAQFIGGVIERSGPTATFSDTTPTATQIIAAIPGIVAGMSFEMTIVNTATRDLTLLAGADVTLALTTGVISATSRRYTIKITNVVTPAVTVYGLISGPM